MRIVIQPTAAAAARSLAAGLARVIRRQPSVVIGLPTGRTPISLYAELVELHRRGRADFRRVTTFNLDEFIGLAPNDPRSYRAFMQRHLFQGVNLDRRRIHFLDGRARSWRREADRYETEVAAAGGLDVVIVGIGDNGHLGFNEPARTLEARTHRVTLRAATRRANAWLFGGLVRAVPTHALSMGIGTILSARHVVLLATGPGKASIVRRALTGPVTTRVPASLLQLHPNALVVLDRDAASAI